MSLELFDFAPLFRLLDAHALWHLATIPLAAAWWRFLCSDAIDLESAQIGREVGTMPLSGGLTAPGGATPKTPGMSNGTFQSLASGSYPTKGGPGMTPRQQATPRSRSPGVTKGEMQE